MLDMDLEYLDKYLIEMLQLYVELKFKKIQKDSEEEEEKEKLTNH